jgi:predicted Zn-dependent peptidase
VRDRAVAQRVTTQLNARRGPSLFSIDTKLSQKAKVADVERLIEAEIKALAARPPSPAELEKARRRAQARLVLGLQWNRDRSIQLGKFELLFGDARQVNNELGRYLAVTKDDISRVVAKHLGPTRQTIVETLPTEKP